MQTTIYYKSNVYTIKPQVLQYKHLKVNLILNLKIKFAPNSFYKNCEFDCNVLISMRSYNCLNPKT